LRAVAIIPVVLFHAGVPAARGGFVGVDVFFVISGYLITSLIVSEYDRGAFSIVSFYERRARRILPALFVVLGGATILAYRLLLPNGAADFGRTLLGTVLFASNIMFSRSGGYFDPLAETKPLLHTWSLAVEEQFYLLYPVVLLFLLKRGRSRALSALLGILAVSFFWSVVQVRRDPLATFYLTPSRIWELLVGGALAMGLVPPVRRRLVAECLGLLGVAALILSVMGLSATTPFPGVVALGPTLGAALIIYSGTAVRTTLSAGLSTRPAVYVGLISYSLYLWHWVLIVFLKASRIVPPSDWEIAVAVGLSVVAAILSRALVEQPFLRQRPRLGSRPAIFAAALAGSLALGVIGLTFSTTGGLPGRFSADVRALASDADDYWPRRKECDFRICRIGADSARPRFLLWGDSHAGAIAPVFDRIAMERGLSGRIAFASACAPLLGFERYDLLAPGRCKQRNAAVIAYVDTAHIKTVFLHARWAIYAEGQRNESEAGRPVLLTPDHDPSHNYEEFATELRSTIERLRSLGVNVIIIASVPEVGLDVPTSMAMMAETGRVFPVAPRFGDFLRRQSRTFALFSRAATDPAVWVAYPHRVMCDQSSCAVVSLGHSLYFDDDHLSIRGSLQLEPLIAPLVDSLALTPGRQDR
jgi:peptidoglycan/LPS O-acetylase OafA/YrhL